MVQAALLGSVPVGTVRLVLVAVSSSPSRLCLPGGEEVPPPRTALSKRPTSTRENGRRCLIIQQLAAVIVASSLGLPQARRPDTRTRFPPRGSPLPLVFHQVSPSQAISLPFSFLPRLYSSLPVSRQHPRWSFHHHRHYYHHHHHLILLLLLKLRPASQSS